MANPPSEPAPASLGGSWTLFKWGLASKVGPTTQANLFACLLKTCLGSPLIHLYQPVPSFWWPLIGSKVFLDLIGLFS